MVIARIVALCLLLTTSLASAGEVGTYLKEIPDGFFKDQHRIDSQERLLISLVKEIHAKGYTLDPTRSLINRSDLEAATRFRINPLLLAAVVKHESGETCMANRNTDGSYDLGRAQINTIHAEELYERKGIKLSDIACDDRTNSNIGAWHLRNKIVEGNGDPWVGVGRYHDKRSRYAVPYIKKVRAMYITLLNRSIEEAELILASS